jgi:threonine/homoserine/homoserine lactone efflux protein
MVDVSWFVFCLASLVLIATPGQDMILVMSRSVSQGTLAGLATAAGVSVGLMGHTILAALGVGAIVKASATLFLLLKLIGGGYLIYLGIVLLRTKRGALQLAAATPTSTARLFFDGAFSNIANPKIIIFYFAFLPQFVTPTATRPGLAIFLLGSLFAALTFVVKAPIAYWTGALSTWLRSRPAALVWAYRSSGAVLVGLGAKLVFERRE